MADKNVNYGESRVRNCLEKTRENLSRKHESLERLSSNYSALMGSSDADNRISASNDYVLGNNEVYNSPLASDKLKKSIENRSLSGYSSKEEFLNEYKAVMHGVSLKKDGTDHLSYALSHQKKMGDVLSDPEKLRDLVYQIMPEESWKNIKQNCGDIMKAEINLPGNARKIKMKTFLEYVDLFNHNENSEAQYAPCDVFNHAGSDVEFTSVNKAGLENLLNLANVDFGWMPKRLGDLNLNNDTLYSFLENLSLDGKKIDLGDLAENLYRLSDIKAKDEMSGVEAGLYDIIGKHIGKNEEDKFSFRSGLNSLLKDLDLGSLDFKTGMAVNYQNKMSDLFSKENLKNYVGQMIEGVKNVDKVTFGEIRRKDINLSDGKTMNLHTMIGNYSVYKFNQTQGSPEAMTTASEIQENEIGGIIKSNSEVLNEMIKDSGESGFRVPGSFTPSSFQDHFGDIFGNPGSLKKSIVDALPEMEVIGSNSSGLPSISGIRSKKVTLSDGQEMSVHSLLGNLSCYNWNKGRHPSQWKTTSEIQINKEKGILKSSKAMFVDLLEKAGL